MAHPEAAAPFPGLSFTKIPRNFFHHSLTTVKTTFFFLKIGENLHMERIRPWERILCTFSERILRSQGMRGRNELVGIQICLVPRPYSEPLFYDCTGRVWTGSPPQSSRGKFSQRQGRCPHLLHPRQPHGIHGQRYPKPTSHQSCPELPVPIWYQGFTPGSQGHTLPDPLTCAVTADALQGPRKGAHLPWALPSSPSEASEEMPQRQGSEHCTDLAFSARTPQKSPCTS